MADLQEEFPVDHPDERLDRLEGLVAGAEESFLVSPYHCDRSNR